MECVYVCVCVCACVCSHACYLSGPTNTWTPCPLPCASILTWRCCPASVCDTCLKELVFAVPLSPQEDMARVTEPFFMCSNLRDGRLRSLVMPQAQELGGAAVFSQAVSFGTHSQTCQLETRWDNWLTCQLSPLDIVSLCPSNIHDNSIQADHAGVHGHTLVSPLGEEPL